MGCDGNGIDGRGRRHARGCVRVILPGEQYLVSHIGRSETQDGSVHCPACALRYFRGRVRQKAA